MDVVYLRVELGADSLLLRLAPDPSKQERALARLGDRALSYLDLHPAEPLRAGMGAFARACEQEPARDEAEALGVLSRAVARVHPAARLIEAHRVSTEQRLPRWPVSMRSGAPRPREGELWPFDAELTGMTIGTRRLLLREWLDEAGADADARWLASHGLCVRTFVGEGGRRVLFAAREESLLEEARAWDARVHGGGDGWQTAVRWMGDALGYPRCCVERFVRVRRRDDLSMFVDLLPPLPARPAPPSTGWLDGAITLLSFAPCSPWCEAARDLGERTLAALDAEHPGFAALWERHARAIHAIDERGACVVLTGEGALDAGVDVERALVLEPTAGPSPKRSTLDVSRVVLSGGRLADADGHLRASLVADHRGGRSTATTASSPATSAGDGAVTPTPRR